MDRNIGRYPEEDRKFLAEVLIKAESEEFCLKGWADEERNRNGSCCCNCAFQRPINGHPWNKDPLVKTSVSQIVGWGCASPGLHPFITFSDRPHGMCEMYSRKPYGD